MRLLRPLAIAIPLLLVTAAHATPARVSGGGFYRDGSGRNQTKTMLTINGSPASNSGTADWSVTKPGSAKQTMHLTLSCVVVNGHTAYASGHDSGGAEWFVKVIDNGEPGRNDQWGISRTGDSVAGVGLLPLPGQLSTTCRASNVATRVITGGNFQVVAAS
jgi:hypothetical protein